MITDLQQFGPLLTDVDLKKYNTYHIGGIAKYLISPTNSVDLINLIDYLKRNHLPYIILGNGSNIVLNDEPFNGVYITFKNMRAYQFNEEDQTAYAEAGAMLSEIALKSIDYSLKGLEFACGIPGTVGGSIYGNAGAYNSCILDYVSEVTIIDENMDVVTKSHDDLTYGYRTSIFKSHKDWLILAATFKLSPGDKEASLEIIKDRQQRRVATQPLEYPSAGSVFRNPEGDYAGRLIEMCNLKGYKIGGACVSEKHANFIINTGNATSKDIYNLIKYVHDTVLTKTGVDLIIEQEFIGWE